MKTHAEVLSGGAKNIGVIDMGEQEQPALLARLQDGRSLPIEACNCRHCGNEWFMASLSPEWMPSFCPYCGIKFVGKTTDGEPDDFLPTDSF